ncbi:Pectinesterase inhibitor [Fagus crenata]
MNSIVSWAAILTLFLLNQSLSEVGADLISDSCAKTRNNDLCVTYLRSDPRSASATDTKGLTRIIYDLVLSSATDTLAQVKTLLNGATDPTLINSLNLCSDGYTSTIFDKIPNALKNLDSNVIVTAASLISDGMFQAQICEKSFSSIGPEIRTSPITDKNTKVIDLSDIALRLTASLG